MHHAITIRANRLSDGSLAFDVALLGGDGAEIVFAAVDAPAAHDLRDAIKRAVDCYTTATLTVA